MDKILNKLYYDDKLGVAGKANFIKKVRASSLLSQRSKYETLKRVSSDLNIN